MIVLGLILVTAAAVFGTEIVLSNTQAIDGGEAFGRTVEGMTAGETFLAGAGTALVLVVGLLMIAGGMSRLRTRRSRMRHVETELRQDNQRTEATMSELVEENERLRAELTEERRARDTLGGVAVPPGAGPAYDTRTFDTTGPATGEQAAFDPYPGQVGQSVPSVEVEPERRRV